MKSTPENLVKKMVKMVLEQNGIWYYSASAGMYSTGGIPDIVGCHNGKFFGIEVKSKTGKATALQLKVGGNILDAGGMWFIVRDAETLAIAIKEIIG